MGHAVPVALSLVLWAVGRSGGGDGPRLPTSRHHPRQPLIHLEEQVPAHRHTLPTRWTSRAANALLRRTGRHFTRPARVPLTLPGRQRPRRVDPLLVFPP